MGELNPALEDALRDRPVLAEALTRDPELQHNLTLLSEFLTALEAHMPDRWLRDRLLADLLPSDQALLDAHVLRSAMQRELEKHAPTMVTLPVDLLNDVKVIKFDQQPPPNGGAENLPTHRCMVVQPEHTAHSWWYTAWGGGHQLRGEPTPEDRQREKGLTKYWCRGEAS